jgi:hypothetical protein
LKTIYGLNRTPYIFLFDFQDFGKERMGSPVGQVQEGGVKPP